MEVWAEKVRQFEYGYALQQLAKGHDVNVIMEAMSARIQQKLLHPIIQDIKEAAIKNYNVDKDRQEYFNKKTGPVADHIDDVIDKDNK